MTSRTSSAVKVRNVARAGGLCCERCDLLSSWAMIDLPATRTLVLDLEPEH